MAVLHYGAMVTVLLWAAGVSGVLALVLFLWGAFALRPSLMDHEMVEPGDLE